ncbi:polymorphic toxin-type HINT domain-containing protein [Streptomyces sp. NRRL S-920]|uniref:polymorphic toxin-type HINT domain-containing protein n=1 Tax=Streptomyces sp. NRRL S-920 TaxID=1463921 RepID=UPI000D12447F|nr:polymorphic toxin-type HINT domain-containing protein [Streptomyces sp. NRRL S-920]
MNLPVFGLPWTRGTHRPARPRTPVPLRTRRIAAVTGFALLPGLLSPVTFAADTDPLGRPELDAPRSSKVTPFTAKVNKKSAKAVAESAAADRAAARRARAEQRRTVTWPKSGKATLALPPSGKATAKPGALPLTLAAPQQTKNKKKRALAADTVQVRVLDQQETKKLGIKGIGLTVTGPKGGGAAQLGLDYKAFASAYGADWAGRLQLSRLPDCALDTPAKAACRTRTPLSFTNHRKAERLTAPLTFPATAKSGTAEGRTMMLALAAGTKSGSGDYKATPLASSSTWEAGGSSGSFTWSYPLRTPPAAAGPQPELSISYDSGSVDGRTANTNNQGTTIGEGFDLTSSYIERKYGSCEDDGQDKKYDLCWKYDNASLVLNGQASELVKDDSSGKWRLKNDDASTVTHRTGADNGDDDGEYWTVTTGEGAVYTFGLNKLEGAGADERTQSVWTVPVFGDDKDEPGYEDGTSFSSRDKKQAWRWNLDLVQDTHANAMTYWYTAEQNNYDKLGDDNTGTDYTRGGRLKEIRYGQRAGSLFSAKPAASNKVAFTYAERCDAPGTGCDALTEDTRDNWPDVPFDAVCKDGDKCTGNVGPAFFTRKRLTGITTYAWNAAAGTPGFTAVDAWSLKQDYQLDPGDTGDSRDQSLSLKKIEHTGKRGTDLSLDPVTFSYVSLPNRVDGATDDIISLDKPRLRTITSETGAQTNVSYAEADCVAGQSKPKVDDNTRRCYPVHWSPNGEKTPIVDWFHKYPVTAVSTTDQHGGSEAVQHTYQYSGGGAWHYNDDPMTPAKERTWSIWRGYGKVTHLTGDKDSAQLKEVSVYLRGMNGDRVLDAQGKAPDPDKRKSVKVTGIKAAEITDSDQYAGFTRENVTYNGDAEVSGTINDPWSKRTATQHKSYADTEAYYVRTAASHARTNITSTATPRDRIRTTKTTYDDFGMAETVEDSGDDAVPGDETCTRTWYARNDDKDVNINSLVSRTRTVAKTCAVTDANLDLPADSDKPGDVVADTATVYDDPSVTTWSASQTPTKGEATWTGRAKAYTIGNTATWQKTSTTSYDTLGRPLVIKDINDLATSTTAYTPTAAGPLTSTSITNAKQHKATTAVDFATGASVKATDPNDKVTETEYDSLGRVTKVWLPNRSTVLGKTPNYVYDYKVTSKDLSWVSTGSLKGDGSGYNTAYEFYDSLLRPRQTQTPTPVGGRLVSLTLYDDRGLAVSAQGDIWDDTSPPSATAVQTEGSQAPVQSDTTYDGAGRATKAVTKNYGVTRWTTRTTHTGDTVATSAPTGGQATAEVTNALGQLTQRREYGGPQPTGTDFTTTDYTYTPAGQQKTLTGPDEAKWTYGYDLFGRQVTSDDPDKGTTRTTYDSLDRPVTTTDEEDRKLITEYDDLNRRTGLWQTDRTNANKLAAWTFDLLAKGQQDTAVRYDGGATGKAYTQKVTQYDSLYQVMGNQLTLPDDDPLVKAGVPKTFSFTTGYRLDGTISQASEPAVAGLPAETVGYTYNATGQQLKSVGANGYLSNAVYSPQGDLRQHALGVSSASSAKKAYLNYDYEPGTRRLTRSYVTDDVHGYMPQELKYTQDDAGNVTSIFDATTQGGTAKPDYQCFTYDGHRRLAEAWTPKTADCASAGRTAANIDGAAPYWTSYAYNQAGQRKTETQHAGSGDKTTNYTYRTTQNQPHPLVKTETAGKTQTYTYDKTGNTTSRPDGSAQQSLTWNTEGKLARTAEGPAQTDYLYDADGQLLIRRAKGDGDTVLYLGATEVRLTAKGTAKTLSGSRYYTANGQTIAVRTTTPGASGTELSFLAADHHGTASLALDATTYVTTKRYTTPFGAPRGEKAANWPDDKAFLGKPADTATGLTHVGAREYDPRTGQFLSLDPLMQTDIHQTLNGYTYGAQNPLSNADPSGLGLKCGGNEPAACPKDGNDGHEANGGSGYGGGGGGGGTAPTSSSGRTGGSGGSPTYSCDWTGRHCVPKQYARPGPADSKTGDTIVLGLISNLIHTSEYFGALVDSDCRDVDYCTYGEDYDKWVASKGYDTESNSYLVPGFLASMFAHKSTKSGAPRKPKKGISSKCKCFLPGTDVLMADDSTKNIEDVEVGEKVLATDPVSGESGPREVTRLIVTDSDKRFNTLSIATDDGIKKLTATHEHPFWSASERRWIEAGELRPGMSLLTDDGDTVIVTGNHAFTKRARTYNLTVEGLHTYYVVAGATPVLVHNSNCPPAETVDNLPEVTAPKPLKPSQVDQAWSAFLGSGPYTNIHPRTGQVDRNRLVSSDGRRSIRMGDHEMNSKPTKFHYHMETWDWNSVTNTWTVGNTMQRVPLGVK